MLSNLSRWLNRSEAPRWVEVLPVTNLKINKDESEGDQRERFGTSWARDIIDAVAAISERPITFNGLFDLYGDTQDNTNASLLFDDPLFRENDFEHASHESGLGIDIQIISQQSTLDLPLQHPSDDDLIHYDFASRVEWYLNPAHGLNAFERGVVQDILAFFLESGELYNGVYVGDPNRVGYEYSRIREALDAIGDGVRGNAQVDTVITRQGGDVFVSSEISTGIGFMARPVPGHWNHFHIRLKPLSLPQALIANMSLMSSSMEQPIDTNLESTQIQGNLDRAISEWDTVGLSLSQVTQPNGLEIRVSDLPGSALAESTANLLTLDIDAAGHGWFIDQTPWDNEEFTLGSSSWEFLAQPGSEAAGRIDLLTVLAHEMGHVLGLSDIDPTHSPTHLMTGSLPTGVRRLPSVLDLGLPGEKTTMSADSSVVAYQPLVAEPWYQSVTSTMGETQTFTVPMSLEAAQPHPGIVNGEFTVGDPASPQFDWTTRGAATVENGELVLREDDRVFSGVSQAFLIPAGARALRFTITSASFGENGSAPPDAFEVALLDAATLQALAGLVPLSLSDSLLNIQSSHRMVRSSAVTVSGLATGGDTLPLDGLVTIDIDLTGIAAGTAARVYFDLLGFGPANSRVSIDHVTLIGAQGNRPPVAVNDAVTVVEDHAVTFSVVINDTDADENPLTATVVDQPRHGILVQNPNGTFTYTPAANFNGTDSFTYRANDGQADSANVATVSLTVTPVNDTPVLAPIGNRTIDEGQLLTVVLSATDVDLPADTLTYSASGLPTGATFDPATRTFVWTPTDAQGPGLFTGITLSVTDGTVTVNETIGVIVNEVNEAPVFTSAPLTTATEGQLYSYDANATDADLPLQTLLFSLLTAPVGMTINGSTGQIEWKPTAAQVGDQTVTVGVMDGAIGTPVTQTFTVTTEAVTQAFTLDVDGNGVADAVTDGILIIRYLFGFVDTALTRDAMDPAGSRTNSHDIISYLDQARSTMLDPDGSGLADALTDGFVIIRYLFGFTGETLTDGVLDPGGSRNTAEAIESFLLGFLPAPSPSVQQRSIVASALVAPAATTPSSNSTAGVVPVVDLTIESMSLKANETTPLESYSLAYVQQSWVKDFVAPTTNVTADDEELLIQLV